MNADPLRRTLLAALLLPALPRMAHAQPTAVPRVGILIAGSRLAPGAVPPPGNASFVRRMAELGWVEGRTVSYDFRFGDGRPELLAEMARELVRQDVAVIVAMGPAPTTAAKEATRAIPIVMGNADPVEQGLIASFGRPGGNITGWSFVSVEVAEKQLEMLKEAVPRLARVGVLTNRNTPAGHTGRAKAIAEMVRTHGLSAQLYEVADANGLDAAFTAMARDRMQALMVLAEPAIIDGASARIAALCVKHRLPAMYLFRFFVDAGGLMSYGPSLGAMGLRFAYFTDRLLRGTKAADLPVERPDKYEMVINLKAAEAIGFTMPPRFLAFADEVIR